MILMAALTSFCARHSVRNTTLWFDRPKKRRRGKMPLTTWLSHFVQISVSVIVWPPDLRTPMAIRTYHQALLKNRRPLSAFNDKSIGCQAYQFSNLQAPGFSNAIMIGAKTTYE